MALITYDFIEKVLVTIIIARMFDKKYQNLLYMSIIKEDVLND